MPPQASSGKVVPTSAGSSSVRRRWALFGLVLLLLILLPFFLFEELLTKLANDLLAAPPSPWILGPSVGLLLASDVILPIPSSIVSTAGGALLGFWAGTFASFAGMTLGAVVGYAVGRYGGRRGTERLVGKAELLRVEELHNRYGSALLVLCRAVPVLAEASVVFAGVTRMPLRRFLPAMALANAGISAVYAATGAFAVGQGSFLLAVAGALALPGVGLGIARLAGGRRSAQGP